MEYKEVESSSVKRIGYDAPSQTLEVTFASARTYRYSGVPTEVANAFLNAKSKGLFVATDLRDKYPYACLNPNQLCSRRAEARQSTEKTDGKPQEESKSVQKRKAAQKGKPFPKI